VGDETTKILTHSSNPNTQIYTIVNRHRIDNYSALLLLDTRKLSLNIYQILIKPLSNIHQVLIKHSLSIHSAFTNSAALSMGG